MKNILLVQGMSQYGAMNTYIDEMEEACLQLGYNTLCLDATSDLFAVRLKNALDALQFDAVMVCNGILLDWNGIREEIRKKIPIYITYLCDHPSGHISRLQYADDHTFVFVCDEEHKEYIDGYMPFIKHSCFVPLAGSFVKDQVKYEKRRRDVVFTGSYQDPKKYRRTDCFKFEGVMQNFMDFMLDLIIQKPSLSHEEVLKIGLQEYGIEVDTQSFQDLMFSTQCIDGYARLFYRDAVLRTLIENGIKIEVFGSGWEEFDVKHKENLIINPGNSYVALKAVADAKISLNVMPWFKAGFQERIATAMLNGAVALTDGSKYIEENLCDEKQLIVYSLEKLEELPNKVKELLDNTEKADQIAKEGQNYAINHARWIHRVMEMLTFVNETMGYQDVKTESGKRLKIYLKSDEKQREKSLEYIAALEKLEENILEVNEQCVIRKGDYDYFRKKLSYLLDLISVELPEIYIGSAILDVIFDEVNDVELYMVEMLVLECKNILEQLYRREKNYLENLLQQQKKCETKEAPLSQMQILCKRIVEHYRGKGDPELEEILKNIEKKQFVDAYNQNFVEKYLNRPIDSFAPVDYDDDAEMYYVLANGKRIYYPKSYDLEKVLVSYRFICIEQDSESPHLYLDDTFQVNEGDVVIDAGVAEGNFSLSVIEKVKKLYLIECDHEWVEALKRTFAPWEEKVVIVEKMLSDMDDDTHITIDTLVATEKVDFIKMDVEGAEEDALKGATNTIKRNNDMKCAICAYHKRDAEMVISKALLENQFKVSTTKGYIFFAADKESWENAELRRGIVRGVKG